MAKKGLRAWVKENWVDIANKRSDGSYPKCGRSGGEKRKNYYVPESVGIATGFLITALHLSGLSCLTHTPNPMGFLSKVCNRPSSNKASLILAVGYPANNAKIPLASTIKKSFDEVVSIF